MGYRGYQLSPDLIRLSSAGWGIFRAELGQIQGRHRPQ